jgi:hypothetical protein
MAVNTCVPIAAPALLHADTDPSSDREWRWEPLSGHRNYYRAWSDFSERETEPIHNDVVLVGTTEDESRPCLQGEVKSHSDLRFAVEIAMRMRNRRIDNGEIRPRAKEVRQTMSYFETS